MKSDVELRTDVEEELSCEPSVDATAIGALALRTESSLFPDMSPVMRKKWRQSMPAMRVLGINVIVTDLDVKLPGSSLVNDEDIARAAIDALSWNTLIPRDRIKVQVECGWLTLQGDVDWHYQKSAAYSGVCNLKGVRGITNEVNVKPLSIHDAVEAHIESALRRAFGKRRNRIKVETRRDHVTLWGTVNSIAESSQAERAAWTTPGVCHVENHLSVARSAATRRSGAAGVRSH